MFTPEKFYHINPAVKPGTLSDDSVQQVPRPTTPLRSEKKFADLLNRPRKVDAETDEVPSYIASQDTDEVASGTAQSIYDPRFNQPPLSPETGSGTSSMPVGIALDPVGIAFDGPPSQSILASVFEDAEKAFIPLTNFGAEPPTENPAANLLQAGSDAVQAKENIYQTPDQLFSSLAMSQKRLLADTGSIGETNTMPIMDNKKIKVSDELAFNPLPIQEIQQPGMIASAAPVDAKPPLEKTYQLMQQIVDQLTIATAPTQADTTITLKNMPQFEGVSVTVTTYPTARGEINISFENLTQAGKQILDLVDNRNALQQALDQKGYIVHMITTTTIERPHVEGGGFGQREGRGEERDAMNGGEGRRQRRHQETGG